MERLLDPTQIKVVNWSRRRKRSKKLWDPNPKRRNAPTADKAISVEELNEWLDGEGK